MNDLDARIARSKKTEAQFNAAIEAAFRAQQAEDGLRAAESSARARNRRMVWIVVAVALWIAAIVFTLAALWPTL